MSQAHQLTKEMYDLVKSIGETRSKQEEDKIILAEQAKLKITIKDTSLSVRRQKENLLRAIYIEMLGHDASFAHFSAVQMAQSKSLQLKRVGYLTCCLFLNESSELLILLVANLQKDLQSKSIHEVIIALTALGKLMNRTILQGVQEQVLKLLVHQTDLVRKKAVIVLQRIHQLDPSSVSDYDDRMRRGLCDTEPSVMGATLNLYHEAIKEDSLKYKESSGSFVTILKQILEYKLPREYNYQHIPAPWIQIKLMQILGMLGKKDQKISEQIYEVLGSALRRSDDAGSKISFAVTYQCVKTIASIYPYEQLLEQAADAVKKFLKSDSNNLKYLGIKALVQIVAVNPSYVLEHQLIIMDCLESSDQTLKKETMELLFKMTNQQNVQAIVDRLVVFLKSAAESSFKKDLVLKITSLVDRHSPSYEWFVRSMNTVFEFGSEFVSSSILNTFLRTLSEHFTTEGAAFGKYLLTTYKGILKRTTISDVTYKLITWVFGEIGAMTYGSDEKELNNIIESLLDCVMNEFEEQTTRGWVLNALAKLSSCKAFSMQSQVQECFEYYADSKSFEVGQRAVEYSVLAKYNAALRQSTMIKVDPQLKFLDAFVARALSDGAAKFDQNKLISAALGPTAAITQASLKFEAYENTNLSRLTINEDVNLKPAAGGNKATPVWGEEGLNEEQLNKPTVNVFGGKQQQEVPPPFIAGVNVYRPSAPAQQPFSQLPAKPVTVIPEDPKKKQMAKMAQSFFNPIAVVNTPSTIPSTSNAGYGKAIAVTSIAPTTKTQPIQHQPSLGLLDDDESQQLYTLPFTPLQIEVDMFEDYWENIKFEEQREMRSMRVNSESLVRSAIEQIGIHVIEVQDNELICAGKHASTSNVALIHATYQTTGQLSITVKSNVKQDIDLVFSLVQRNI